MPSGYTPSNQLEKVGIGEQNNFWGQTLNSNLDKIDKSLDGITTVTLTSLSYVMDFSRTANINSFSRCYRFVGNPPVGGTVTISAAPGSSSKIIFVINETQAVLNFTPNNGQLVRVGNRLSSPFAFDGTKFFYIFDGGLAINNVATEAIRASTLYDMAGTLGPASGAGTITIGGNDLGGLISVATGPSTQAGRVATVRFRNPAYFEPVVVICPNVTVSAEGKFYVSALREGSPLLYTGFHIESSGSQPLLANSLYKWSYFSIQ